MAARSGQHASVTFTGPLSGVGQSVLSMFGVSSKTATKLPGASHGPSDDPAKFSPRMYPLPILLWLGARLPFAAFVAITGLFTYMYHIMPVLPWLMVFLSLDFGIIVCWPAKKFQSKHRQLLDWGPMFSWFIAVSFAVLCGLLNYGMIESWVNTAFLPTETNVLPNTHPLAVGGAGVLEFAAGTRLDTSLSAGYKFWFYNYCAAPIVGPDPESVPVSFWAVGVGCCDSRGKFTCDSAADQSARSAMPLRPHTLGPEITSHYNRAIQMAAAANNLGVAKDPVFVVWHKDPFAVGKAIWWQSTILFFALVFIALCACCGCQSGFMHIAVMQHQPGV